MDKFGVGLKNTTPKLKFLHLEKFLKQQEELAWWKKMDRVMQRRQKKELEIEKRS